MGMMDPVFREINLDRIKELRDNKLSDKTIAGIVTDQTGVDVTEQDITSYMKMNDLASKRMLVNKKTLQTVKKVEVEYAGDFCAVSF